MGKASRSPRRGKSSPLLPRILKWSAGLGVIALIVYGLSQSSGVAYSDKDIAVVDFSRLTSGERRTALQEANRARCTCGCGMTLAQCVATDSTCPYRDTNVQKIRTMVNDADKP